MGGRFELRNGLTDAADGSNISDKSENAPS